MYNIIYLLVTLIFRTNESQKNVVGHRGQMHISKINPIAIRLQKHIHNISRTAFTLLFSFSYERYSCWLFCNVNFNSI